MAKRVKFTDKYDLRTAPREEVAYLKGMEATLTDAQADEVIKAGVADLIADKTPGKRDKADA